MNIPDIIFAPQVDRALGWTVVNALWQVTLIAFITGILLVVLRGKSAQTRYWITNMALLAVLCTSIATFSWYMNDAPTTAGVPTTVGIPILIQATPAWSPAEAQMLPTIQSVQNQGWCVLLSDYFNRYLPLLVLIWFAGMAIFLFRLLGSLMRVYDLRTRMNFHTDPYWRELLDRLVQKSGLRQGITLLESALVRSPLTIGHLRPLILFPIGMINRLSESEVEAILAHELAHVLRRDYLFNILQTLIEALFYFHPAIWWLSAQVRNEREHACDDRAIALLGDKISYAKALVAIQEMAYYPQLSALAFAGTRKSQLLHRVNRLFFKPKTSFNIMEKWISTAFVVCIVFMLAFGQRLQTTNIIPDILTETGNGNNNSGLWEAEFSADSVHLILSCHENKNSWSNSDDFPKSSFINLTVADGETAFQMNRAAGKISFTGKIEGNGGYGRFVFAPDESYRATLAQQGIKSSDDELMLQCFFADFPANYPKTLQKMGFNSIDKDQLTQLAAFRLSENSVKSLQDLAASLGKKQAGLDELIQLKIADVTSESVERMAKAGYNNLDLETVSQFSMQDVNPAYAEELNNAGLGKLSAENLLAAKIQGIDAAYIREMQNLGLGNLDFDNIIALKIQDVDADFVQKMQHIGLGKLDVDNIIALKIQDVDADFIQKMQNIGLGKLDIDNIIALKVQGIDADFIQKAQNLGLGKLDFDEIMSLKIQDIDADFIQKAQNMGLGKLGFDEIMSLKIQDINADQLATYKAMNLGNLSYDDVMQLKIQDITPEMVKTFRDLGFKNLTVDDLVAAKIQDVTPEFIKKAGEKGYKFPNLSEYAGLKIRLEMDKSEK